MDYAFVMAASLGGFLLAFAIAWRVSRHTRQSAERDGTSIVELAKREAEVETKELKANFQLELDQRKAEQEREAQRMELEIEAKLKEIRSHEESLAALDHDIQLRQQKVEKELEEIREEKSELSETRANARRTMANLASMDEEEIKENLRQQVKLDCNDELGRLKKDILEKSEAEVTREAKRTLLAAMQRLSSKPNNEVTASIVQLPNDDMKGRIIGREGRNIKCFETATGTTLLIDDSPQMVLVSSFDPVRREIAREALDRLVKDGRIHPATIEQFVSESRGDVDQIVANAGDAAISQLKISRIHPEIVNLLGKLKFRTSYSQNVLEHSIEVGHLCSIIASEMGLDPNTAKRAGLLHDIGKAIDGEKEGSHAIAGAEYCRQRGEDAVIVNGIAAHHDEVPQETLYAGIVILADTISAVRPGARAETMTAYIDRLKALETLALEFEGVKQAYAIQAGREIRVVVNPNVIEDEAARELSYQIRERIEDELEYPSTIRITLIREQRFVETAK